MCDINFVLVCQRYIFNLSRSLARVTDGASLCLSDCVCLSVQVWVMDGGSQQGSVLWTTWQRSWVPTFYKSV